jgi:hypothetical protein
VALTASCNAKNSFLRLSRVCASLNKADFVNAFGTTPTEAFTPIFFFPNISTGVPPLGEAELDFVGLADASVASPPSSSSSPPNDNFGVPTLRFFFFSGGSFGVDALY